MSFLFTATEHGSCNQPNECICDTGYGGTNCDQDLDVCGHQQPCLHGATCSNEGPDQHSCACPPGYTGTNCQTEINECSPLPCLNGATCIVSLSCPQPCSMECAVLYSPLQDQVNGFECQCAPGWTGNTCSENIDECDPNPCENGGNCTVRRLHNSS